MLAEVKRWEDGSIEIFVPVTSTIPGHTYEVQQLDEGQYDLMQFTGLHDKNGKEIYEGDIVRFETLAKENREYVGVIVYSRHQFSVDVAGIGHIEFFDPYIEVIGNIYSTPELLTA